MKDKVFSQDELNFIGLSIQQDCPYEFMKLTLEEETLINFKYPEWIEANDDTKGKGYGENRPNTY